MMPLGLRGKEGKVYEEKPVLLDLNDLAQSFLSIDNLKFHQRTVQPLFCN